MDDVVAVEWSTGVENAFSNIAEFVPKLVVFLLILVVAFFVAKALQKVVNGVLERVGFDGFVERGGVKAAMDRTRYDASDIIAKLVYYAVLLIGINVAFNVFGPNAITDYINAIVSFLPKIFVAILIVVIAAFLANALKDLVEGALGGLSYGRLLANAAFGVVLYLGVVAALQQIQVAQFITQAVTTALLVALVGVVVVGVGGGLVRPMERRWDDLLDRASEESGRVRAEAQSGDRDPVGSDRPASVTSGGSAASVRSGGAQETGRRQASSPRQVED